MQMNLRMNRIEIDATQEITMLDVTASYRHRLTPPTVTLLGAGPGDPELLTIKACNALRDADLILYDHLVSDDVMHLAPASAEKIYVGKQAARHALAQSEICQLMVAKALEGRRVLRLKGGDGFIFGRGGEEAQALAEAGIPFVVIPGITSAQGAAASTGIPLTHRDHSRALIFTTGHLKNDQTVDLDWPMLARPHQTVVIYMGLGTLPIISQSLIAHGLSPDTPAALIERATTRQERCFTATIQELANVAREHQMVSPTLIVIGEVVKLHATLSPFCAELIHS